MLVALNYNPYFYDLCEAAAFYKLPQKESAYVRLCRWKLKVSGSQSGIHWYPTDIIAWKPYINLSCMIFGTILVTWSVRFVNKYHSRNPYLSVRLLHIQELRNIYVSVIPLLFVFLFECCMLLVNSSSVSATEYRCYNIENCCSMGSQMS